MSDTCPTVKIKDDGSPDGFIVINESDFKEDEHEVFSESEGLASKTKAELVEIAEAQGIDVRGMTKSEIVEALSTES